MTITPDTLVSEILDEHPEAVEVFQQFGVDPLTECAACLCNPLELCETLCDIPDIEKLIDALKERFDKH